MTPRSQTSSVSCFLSTFLSSFLSSVLHQTRNYLMYLQPLKSQGKKKRVFPLKRKEGGSNTDSNTASEHFLHFWDSQRHEGLNLLTWALLPHMQQYINAQPSQKTGQGISSRADLTLLIPDPHYLPSPATSCAATVNWHHQSAYLCSHIANTAN